MCSRTAGSSTATDRASSLLTLIEPLIRPGRVDLPLIEAALGISLETASRNEWWTFYEGRITQRLRAAVDVRLHRTTSASLIVIEPGVDHAPAQDQLELERFGAPVDIEVNPAIPPKGTIAHVFDVGGVKVSFQFVADREKTLRLIAIERLDLQRALRGGL